MQILVFQLTRALSNSGTGGCAFSKSGLDMMTSSNGTIFRVTGYLCGEFIGLRWILHKRPVTRRFDVFFDLHPNKRLSKQWWGWWFETPSYPLWRHRNEMPRRQREMSQQRCRCWLIQSSAVKTRSNLSLYYVWHCNNSGGKCIKY